ncbi:MAG: glucodextranase DOMON-like domain-containing protein, partial [Oleiphilaceae bacterium]|nr:glucodextranase DOMON-like domain-containing protein [Oleiphilaceae bacterium]
MNIKSGNQSSLKPLAAIPLSLALLLGGCLMESGSNRNGTEASIVAQPMQPPTETAGDSRCDNRSRVSFSQQSLPRNLTPRPGPELLYEPITVAPQLTNAGPWQAQPILISGASAYRCGEYLYQDWLFDDRGAAGVPDLEDPFSPTAYLFSPKAGTLTYPTDPVYGNNAADLVEFRVRPQGNNTLFRVTFNTMKDPERVAFTLALGDSDELREWPAQAGVSSPAEWFLTVNGNQAELRDAATGDIVTPTPRVTVDTERRQIQVRVDGRAWNPGNDVVPMALGAGLWDSVNQRYLQPGLVATENQPGGASASGAALFNVAFRDEPKPEFPPIAGRTIVDAAVSARVEGRWWREKAQSEALARGDLSAFAARVDFARLRDRVNDDSGVPDTGHINRIMTSRFEYGQGMDYDSECGGISATVPCDGAMVGNLQPYSLYIPEQTAPESGYGLTMLLHALSANYNQYLGSNHAVQLGERSTGSLVATPAGRGPDGFYADAAEADMFEVWADVAHHYPLDPDWVAMSGFSMGGIGSFRLAGRYPDLFARIMPIVAGGNETLMPSLRHVPVMMWNALLDELQPVTTTESAVTTLQDEGYRMDIWRFETWDHLTAAAFDNYQPGADFLGDALVVRNPARITYIVDSGEDAPRVGMVADKAYWLSDLKAGSPDDGAGRIEAFSRGLGQADPAVNPQRSDAGLLTGGTLDPAIYTRRVVDWQPAEAVPA